MNQNNSSSTNPSISPNTSTNPQPISPNTSPSTSTPISPPVVYDPTRLQISPPFALNQSNLALGRPRPICWLWQQRIPLGGITLLDGARNCSKSLLAQRIAASTSIGAPMLDDTPALQGGVVIVTPHKDAAVSQFPFLSSIPSQLDRIEFLSYVHDPENTSDPSGYRSFSFPQDFSLLFDTVDRINARLIILDDFIELLSRDRRWTEQQLASLIADLNQRLISRDLACLLIRHCGAKGSSARPSVLERSECFQTIAMSRLLITRDPLQRDQLLLTHARCPVAALAPTLILKAGRRTHDPTIASLTAHGTHALCAEDVIENRPDVLHRQLLADYLLQLITESSDSLPVSTLYARSLDSSRSQVQRALKDLLDMGQIEHPSHGFYSAAPTNPVFRRKGAPPTPEEQEAKLRQYALERVAQVKAELRAKLKNEENSTPGTSGTSRAMRYYVEAHTADEELQALLAEEKRRKRRAEEEQRARMAEEGFFDDDDPDDDLDDDPDDDLFDDDDPDDEATTPNDDDPDDEAITPDPELAAAPDDTAALDAEADPSPHSRPPMPAPLHCGLINIPPEYLEEKWWRESYLDNPYPKDPEAEARVHAAFLRYKAEKNAHLNQP